MESLYDIIIIGSGPAGIEAAISASKSGKKACLIERQKDLGGASVNKGTIAGKILREAARTYSNLCRGSNIFNYSLRNDLEVATLIEQMKDVADEFSKDVQQQLKLNNVDVLRGQAKIRDPQSVSIQNVDGRINIIQTQKVFVATGSTPKQHPKISVDHESIMDSDSILNMIYLPESMTVVGGGIIGSVYATIFSILGVNVTWIDEAQRPLGFLEPELSSKLLHSFSLSKGRYLSDSKIISVNLVENKSVITTLNNGKKIESEKMLVAVGRNANIKGLGLDKTGVALSPQRTIQVDENFETNIPNIYAIGDAIGHPGLSTYSKAQGRISVRRAFNRSHELIDVIPASIYTVPEIATVGLTEKQASAQFGDDIMIGIADFDRLIRGQVMGIKDGLLKLIAKKDDQMIVGIHIIGECASELIHLGHSLIENQTSIQDLLNKTISSPTFSEAYHVAAKDALTMKTISS